MKFGSNWTKRRKIDCVHYYAFIGQEYLYGTLHVPYYLNLIYSHTVSEIYQRKLCLCTH